MSVHKYLKSHPPIGMNNSLLMTEMRPTSTQYENIVDNNKYREELLTNGKKIREANLKQLEQKMRLNGVCEKQHSGIVPFKHGGWLSQK